MRLLSRHAPVEEMITPVDNEQRIGSIDGVEVPLKAQKLLGHKPRFDYNVREIVVAQGTGSMNNITDIPAKAQKLLGENAKVTSMKGQQKKHISPDSFWTIRDAEPKISNTKLRSEADSDTVPGAKRGAALPVVQVPMPSSEDHMRSSDGSTRWTGTSTYPGDQPSLESMNREYYDASKQPSFVSQQTSESSVRDMALRKGATPISDTASDAPLISRPFLNALKHRRPTSDRTTSDEPKRSRKIDLTSLFPLPKGSNAAIPVGGLAPSPAVSTPYSEFFPPDTRYAQVARFGSKLRLETEKRSKPLPKQPVNNNGERVKVFESDIYDSNKTHVHRPPKGAKDWFDVLDISSDEDASEPEPEPDAKREEIAPVELPANEIARVQEALPSIFSPYGGSMRGTEATYEDSPTSEVENTALLTRSSQEVLKRRLPGRSVQRSISGEASPRTEPQRDGGSRLAHSRLGLQSVLSLESHSPVDGSRTPATHKSVGSDALVYETASPLELQRPSGPIRKLGTPTGDASTNYPRSWQQPSKSARSKLSETTSPPPDTDRSIGSPTSDSSPIAQRKLSAVHELSPHSSSSRKHVSSARGRDGARSAGAETTSSIPTETSRMMAVTEEEMMLLELMRRKRAAMQNDSFSEGYRVAMQEERQSQTSQQDFTHNRDLTSSKHKNEANVQSSNVRITESMLRDEIDQRRRMSALRKEDVDREFKLGRFLAPDASSDTHAERSTKIERFLAMAPGIAEEFGGRPVSGTEIETDSRYGETDEREDELSSSVDKKESDEQKPELEGESSVLSQHSESEDVSLGEEEEEELQVEEMGTPRPPQAFSPMQRLTDQVRGVRAPVSQAAAKNNRDPFDKIAPFPRSHRPALTVDAGAKLRMPGEDIVERSILHDAHGRELLSPQVYTPSTSTPKKTPRLPDLDTVPSDEDISSRESVSELKIDSPDEPVATTWARTSGLKQPVPKRTPLGLDMTPFENHRIRTAPPSTTTYQASPLTPIFAPLPSSPDGTVSELGGEISSIASEPLSALPNMPSQFRSYPVSPASEKKSVKSDKSLYNESLRPKVGRITSMASITSAGEDVLAAWAELGGGRADALVSRRRKKT